MHANSLTFANPADGSIVLRVEFYRPVGQLINAIIGDPSILQRLARSTGLGADEHEVPEHRRHLDPAGQLMLGYGLGAQKVSQLGEHVFETRGRFVLQGGKRTGPSAVTYVDVDTREFEVVLVTNWGVELAA